VSVGAEAGRDSAMNSQLDEQTAELLGGVDEIIVAVRDGLGELDTSQLQGLRDWIKDMHARLRRLDYAIAVALPLAELQDQIAVAEATDRLAQERERVAEAKAPKSGSP